MDFWIYLAIMALSTYLIRTIPFACIRKQITNRFLRSLLYYIPYAVLAAMTFPAVLYAVQNMTAAAAGFVTAILFALWGRSMTTVAVAACAAVYLVNWLMTLV